MTWRTRLPMLAAFSSLISVTFFFYVSAIAQDLDSTERDKSWFTQPEPGVTLIGTANSWAKLDLGSMATISPDAEYLVGVQNQKNLVVVHRESMKVVHEVPIDMQSVIGLSFSGDGLRLAVFGYDYEAELDDEGMTTSTTYTSRCVILDADFRVLHKIKFQPVARKLNETTHINIPISVKFSPDSSQAIIACQAVSYWLDVDSGEILDTQPHISDPNITFISNDLAFLWRNGELWNLKDREVKSASKIGKLAKPSNASYFMPHPSGPIIAYCDRTKSEFTVANWENGEFLCRIPIKDYIVFSGHFSQSGNLFSAFCYTKDYKSTAIAIFDLEREELTHVAKLSGRQAIDSRFIDDDAIIVFQPNRGMTELQLDDDFELNAKRELMALPISLTMEVNHDGSILLENFAQASVNLNNGDILSSNGSFAPCSTFGKQNNLVLLGTHQGKLQLKDLDTNEIKKEYQLPTEIGVVKGILNLLGRQKEQRIVRPPYPAEIRVSDDGKTISSIIVQQNDSTVSMEFCSWDSESGRQSANVRFPKALRMSKNSRQLAARISPSCQRLAYATKSQVIVVDSATLKPEIEFDISAAELIEFSHDEKFLAIGYDSEGFHRVNKLEIYDLETGELVKEFDRPNQMFAFAAHAGKFAIFDGKNRQQVEVYDTDDWDNARTFETDYAPRNAIAFSGDGKRLVSCLNDTRVEVWDLDKMEE